MSWQEKGFWEHFFNQRLSRRKLGKKAVEGAAAFAVVKLGIEAAEKPIAINQQLADWNEANLPDDAFLKRHENHFGLIKLGCSFSPEQLGYVYSLLGGTEAGTEQGIEALKLARELGISEIRLGIRWSIVAPDGNFNSKIFNAYYKPYLDYCIENGININLNVGPIKTFRFPEEHVPQAILNRLSKMPKNGETIDPDSELAQESFQHLNAFLPYLISIYDKEQLSRITTVQPENEAFHSAGKGTHGWKVSKEYLIKAIDIIHTYLPDAKILLNSSTSGEDLKTIRETFKEVVRKYRELKGNLICGVNFYYNHPDLQSIPFTNVKLDPITLSELKGNNVFKENRDKAKEDDIEVTVEEAQLEPWMIDGEEVIRSPGNSVREFKYLLLRSMRNILIPGKEARIMLWGFERFAQAKDSLSSEQKRILYMVREINRINLARAGFPS